MHEESGRSAPRMRQIAVLASVAALLGTSSVFLPCVGPACASNGPCTDDDRLPVFWESYRTDGLARGSLTALGKARDEDRRKAEQLALEDARKEFGRWFSSRVRSAANWYAQQYESGLRGAGAEEGVERVVSVLGERYERDCKRRDAEALPRCAGDTEAYVVVEVDLDKAVEDVTSLLLEEVGGYANPSGKVPDLYRDVSDHVLETFGLSAAVGEFSIVDSGNVTSQGGDPSAGPRANASSPAPRDEMEGAAAKASRIEWEGGAILAGVTYTNWREVEQASPVFGFSAGFTANRLRMGSGFALDLSFFVLSKGVSIEGSESSGLGPTTFRLYYVTATPAFQIGGRAYVVGGLEVGYLVHATTKAEFLGETLQETITEAFDRTEVSGVVGLGLPLGNGSFEVRYLHGWSGLSADGRGVPQSSGFEGLVRLPLK